MAFPKPDGALVDALHDAVMGVPGVERRKMFGCAAVFLHDHMFGGVFGDCLNLRLSETDRATALALPGFHTFEPMEGRPMREYVCLPPDLAHDRRALDAWVTKATAFVRTLPPKPPKKPRKPRAKKA